MIHQDKCKDRDGVRWGADSPRKAMKSRKRAKLKKIRAKDRQTNRHRQDSDTGVRKVNGDHQPDRQGQKRRTVVEKQGEERMIVCKCSTNSVN